MMYWLGPIEDFVDISREVRAFSVFSLECLFSSKLKECRPFALWKADDKFVDLCNLCLHTEYASTGLSEIIARGYDDWAKTVL